ncbi:hypothetical protein COLO4_24295 [Corchorus olitorius]|uniref:Uncharacterized protein n=1 Tax=Corchorus olitorius TaxID=93759 RepID=A0A1R3IBG3_9ROSI|nr:hypothetical protein COLO4_24295 [Corchorus olitorius]
MAESLSDLWHSFHLTEQENLAVAVEQRMIVETETRTGREDNKEKSVHGNQSETHTSWKNNDNHLGNSKQIVLKGKNVVGVANELKLQHGLLSQQETAIKSTYPDFQDNNLEVVSKDIIPQEQDKHALTHHEEPVDTDLEQVSLGRKDILMKSDGAPKDHLVQ